MSQIIPGRIKIYPPVHADNIAAGSPETLEKSTGAGAEVDDWNARSHVCNGGVRMGKNKSLVILGGQAASPTIEELHSLRPGCDLSVQIFGGERRKSLHQAAPGTGIRVDEPLRFEIVAGGAALDEIRGKGKGCTCKSNKRHFPVQGGASLAHGLE